MILSNRLKKILDSYQSTLKFNVSKPKDLIGSAISKTVKVSGAIKMLKVTECYIEIEIDPAVFDASAPAGCIKMELMDNKKNAYTIIVCKIIPTSFKPGNLYLLITLLLIWTVGGLLFSQSLYAFLTVLFGWVMMIIAIHIKQVLNKGKLENYARHVLMSAKLWNPHHPWN